MRMILVTRHQASGLGALRLGKKKQRVSVWQEDGVPLLAVRVCKFHHLYQSPGLYLVLHFPPLKLCGDKVETR